MRQDQFSSRIIPITFFLFLTLILVSLSCVPYQASSVITTKPPADTKTFQQKEEETMNSWLNSHKSSLIQAWGPPDRVTSDGLDGEILIYEQTVHFPEFGSVTRIRMFYVNKIGIIYNWLCKGRQGN